MVALLVIVLLRLFVHCGELDGSRQFRVGRLDDAGELCGYSVDTSGNLGVKLFLGWKLSNGIDSLGIICLSLDDTSKNRVSFLLARFLREGIPGLDGGSNI